MPPRYFSGINDSHYAVTIAVMMIVSLIAGHLTAGLHYQAVLTPEREERTSGLHDFARSLSGALMDKQVFETAQAYVAVSFGAGAAVPLTDAADRIDAATIAYDHHSATLLSADLKLAQ